jgi:hypothetical protein
MNRLLHQPKPIAHGESKTNDLILSERAAVRYWTSQRVEAGHHALDGLNAREQGAEDVPVRFNKSSDLGVIPVFTSRTRRAFGVGFSVEVPRPAEEPPGRLGTGRANNRWGACRCWPSQLGSTEGTGMAETNRAGIEAQRRSGHRRCTTVSGSRTWEAIQVSTSVAGYRTWRPTRRCGGPFPDARQFASVATGTPSSSVSLSSPCKSFVMSTRPKPRAKSRGHTR